MKFCLIAFLIIITVSNLPAQSRRFKDYSESPTRTEKATAKPTPNFVTTKSDDVIRVDTDLVTVPVHISDNDGRPIPDVRQTEFRIIENGVEQEIAYFQNE